MIQLKLFSTEVEALAGGQVPSRLARACASEQARGEQTVGAEAVARATIEGTEAAQQLVDVMDDHYIFERSEVRWILAFVVARLSVSGPVNPQEVVDTACLTAVRLRQIGIFDQRYQAAEREGDLDAGC